MGKRVFNVKLVSETDLMMHKFNGQDKEKEIKNLSEREQAEKHAYRDLHGNLAVPREWIKGTFMDAVEQMAGRKWRTESASVVARIMVEPSWIKLTPQEYTIDIRSVPSPKGAGKSCRDFCVRPLISSWTLSFQLITTLPDSMESLKEKMVVAGHEIGMGSNRPNGYGRFTVASFTEATT